MEKLDLFKMKLTQEEKNLFIDLVKKDHTVFEVAAKLDIAYQTASNKIGIWKAKGWLIRGMNRTHKMGTVRLNLELIQA